MIAKERLYLTADKKEVVRGGDKRAAYLLYGIGDEIDTKTAERYGIVNGMQAKESKCMVETKEIKTAENKRSK